MPLISDAVARAHLRVPDDEDISLYVNAAEQWVTEYLDRKVFEDQTALDAALDKDEAGDDPLIINDLVRAAMLTLLGHLYENRETVVTGTIAIEVPMSTVALLWPHRRRLGA